MIITQLGLKTTFIPSMLAPERKTLNRGDANGFVVGWLKQIMHHFKLYDIEWKMILQHVTLDLNLYVFNAVIAVQTCYYINGI